MPDLSRHSLEQLRRLAREHGLASARDLPRAALVEWLGPRLAAGLSDEAPATGRLVVRPRAAAMSVRDDEPVEARGLETLGSPAGSGAGKKDSVPLEPPAEPIPDLPWAYEDDRVVLLVRDPKTLFTYWDFHPDTVTRARDGLGGDLRAVLRLTDLSGSEPRTVKEVDVDLGWRSYYFYELEPNRDCRVELVFVDAEGREQLIGRRSNVATLPPDHPSAWVEDRFASIPLDVPLPEAAVFAQGRVSAGEGGERRLHARAWELSGGETMTGDEASSESGVSRGFGGRGWSGSLVRR